MLSTAEQESVEQSFALQPTGTDGAAALRQTVAERVARHRSRRAVQAQQEASEIAQRREELRAAARTGISRVRDTVAARYQQTPSYREYLAAEAERALLQAQAEAEVARRKVRAVAEAQLQLLQEIEDWKEPPTPREQALEQVRTETREELAHALADIAMGACELIQEPEIASREQEPALSRVAISDLPTDKPVSEITSGGLTVRLYDGLEKTQPKLAELKSNRQRPAERLLVEPEELHELGELDQEIELRHSAELLAPHTLETTPIPANIIEFPRQLIAPRKARPRLAEGPLREDTASEPQLRIFEVSPEQIATEPEAAPTSNTPVWQDLLLEAPTQAQRINASDPEAQFAQPPQVASLGKRLFATAVDTACLLAATAGFLEVAFQMGAHGLEHAPLPLLAASVGGSLLAFYTLYQLLFFTLNEATPGMRAAHIALCTFSDDNPSRGAMRRRIVATFLAACPLGIGLLWSFLDDEELGWHDRMSRMYQRSY
jgi:uncharacterized RDD family membrane protein YckC